MTVPSQQQKAEPIFEADLPPYAQYENNYGHAIKFSASYDSNATNACYLIRSACKLRDLRRDTHITQFKYRLARHCSFGAPG
jgi:hypothetical protein